MSCAKTAEPIEMPFGLRTRVAQGTVYSTRSGPDHPYKGGNFEGDERPIVSVGHCGELCKTATPIDMPFGFSARPPAEPKEVRARGGAH